jgi:hypothetical protein
MRLTSWDYVVVGFLILFAVMASLEWLAGRVERKQRRTEDRREAKAEREPGKKLLEQYERTGPLHLPEDESQD